MKLKTLCFTIFAVFSIISLPARALTFASIASCAASQENYNAKENITNWTCFSSGRIYFHWVTGAKSVPDEDYGWRCSQKSSAIDFGGGTAKGWGNLQAGCNQIYNVKHAFIKIGHYGVQTPFTLK